MGLPDVREIGPRTNWTAIGLDPEQLVEWIEDGLTYADVEGMYGATSGSLRRWLQDGSRKDLRDRAEAALRNSANLLAKETKAKLEAMRADAIEAAAAIYRRYNKEVKDGRKLGENHVRLAFDTLKQFTPSLVDVNQKLEGVVQIVEAAVPVPEE